MTTRAPVWEDPPQDLYDAIATGKMAPQFGEEAFAFHRNNIEFQGRWDYKTGKPSIRFTGWAVLHTKKLQEIYQQKDSPFTLAHRENPAHPYVCLQERNGFHQFHFDTDHLRGWERYEIPLAHLKELSYEEFLEEAHQNIDTILKGLVVRGELDQESIDWRPPKDDPKQNIWHTIDQPRTISQEKLEEMLDSLTPSYQDFTVNEVKAIQDDLRRTISRHDDTEPYEEYGGIFVGDVRYAAAVRRNDDGNAPELLLMPSYAKGRQDSYDSLMLADSGDLSLHLPADFVLQASYPAIKKRIEAELRDSFRRTHEYHHGFLPANRMHLLMLEHQPTGFWEHLKDDYEQTPASAVPSCTLPPEPKTPADKLGEELLAGFPKRGLRVQLVLRQRTSYYNGCATSDMLEECLRAAGWKTCYSFRFHRHQAEFMCGASYLECPFFSDDKHLVLTGAVTKEKLKELTDCLHTDRMNAIYKLEGILHLGKTRLISDKQWERACHARPDILDTALRQGILTHPTLPVYKTNTIRIPDQYAGTNERWERIEEALWNRLLLHQKDGSIRKEEKAYVICRDFTKQASR